MSRFDKSFSRGTLIKKRKEKKGRAQSTDSNYLFLGGKCSFLFPRCGEFSCNAKFVYWEEENFATAVGP